MPRLILSDRILIYSIGTGCFSFWLICVMNTQGLSVKSVSDYKCNFDDGLGGWIKKLVEVIS